MQRGFFNQALVRVDAGLASALAQVQRFAKVASILLRIVQAPLAHIRSDQAQWQAGGSAKSILVSGKKFRTL